MFEERTAWGWMPCWWTFRTSIGSSGSVRTLWMTPSKAPILKLFFLQIFWCKFGEWFYSFLRKPDLYEICTDSKLLHVGKILRSLLLTSSVKKQKSKNKNPAEMQIQHCMKIALCWDSQYLTKLFRLSMYLGIEVIVWTFMYLTICCLVHIHNITAQFKSKRTWIFCTEKW